MKRFTPLFFVSMFSIFACAQGWAMPADRYDFPEKQTQDSSSDKKSTTKSNQVSNKNDSKSEPSTNTRANNNNTDNTNFAVSPLEGHFQAPNNARMLKKHHFLLQAGANLYHFQYPIGLINANVGAGFGVLDDLSLNFYYDFSVTGFAIIVADTIAYNSFIFGGKYRIVHNGPWSFTLEPLLGYGLREDTAETPSIFGQDGVEFTTKTDSLVVGGNINLNYDFNSWTSLDLFTHGNYVTGENQLFLTGGVASSLFIDPYVGFRPSASISYITISEFSEDKGDTSFITTTGDSFYGEFKTDLILKTKELFEFTADGGVIVVHDSDGVEFGPTFGGKIKFNF